MHNSTLVFILAVYLSSSAWGHEKHHHAPNEIESKKSEPSNSENEIFSLINAEYHLKVKPIFVEKCLNCHSSNTKYPSYYRWPIANWIINRDIKEAKEHIGMDNGFPFSGHGTPKEDLQAIKSATEKGSMPPWRYRILHSGSNLADSEKKIIINWAQRGIHLIHSRN